VNHGLADTIDSLANIPPRKIRVGRSFTSESPFNSAVARANLILRDKEKIRKEFLKVQISRANKNFIDTRRSDKKKKKNGDGLNYRR